MASRQILCGICDGQNIKKNAKHWCPECKEGLCSAYEMHHGISRITKKHDVILVENFKKLPKYISSIGNHCKEHEKVYTNYCLHHECLCCQVCKSVKHKKCVDILAIKDLIRKAKSSSFLDSIFENMESTKRNIYHVLAFYEQNFIQNKEHRKKLLDEVRKNRRTINIHFDQLEKNLAQELSDLEEKIKGDASRIVSELRNKKRVIENLEHDIVIVKQYASDLQTFLGTMAFKDKIEEIKQYLLTLQTEGTLKKRLIKCNVSDQLMNITTELKTFGSVYVEEITVKFEFLNYIQRAQKVITRPAGTVVKSINDINVIFKSQWNVPKGKAQCSITGGVIRPDGKIIFVDCDYNNRLLILKENGTLIKEIQFSETSRPTDVTAVDDINICVSFRDYRLEIIDTVTYKTMHVIETSNRCCGVTIDKGNIIWYEQKKGIQMKQKSHDTVNTFVKDDSGKYWSYLTVHYNKIYQTHRLDNTVTCYKMNGDEVWHFRDETVIKNPLGITLDNHSNVYVSSENSVWMLSPDGKDSRQILTEEDKFNNPSVVYFEKNRNMLLISNLNGEVFLYSVY